MFSQPSKQRCWPNLSLLGQGSLIRFTLHAIYTMPADQMDFFFKFYDKYGKFRFKSGMEQCICHQYLIPEQT